MGKQSGKNKNPKIGDDKDIEIFNSMAQELKEEGNRMFQKRDYIGARMKYEKAIKLLPKNHIDVSYLRSNMAACYMQMGLSEYPKAISECNLALEVTPKYSKALIKRARCYEGLNRLDLALKDVKMVLKMEPNNIIASEVSDRVTKALEEKGLRVNDTVIELPPEYVEPIITSTASKAIKEKKKSKKIEEKVIVEEKISVPIIPIEQSEAPRASNAPKMAKEKTRKKKNRNEIEEKKVDSQSEVKIAQDKVVIEEEIRVPVKVQEKAVKLVFGDDIRWAKLPVNCSLEKLREVVYDRFPNSGEFLIKYRDQEGDLITITSDEELRLAESSGESQASIRLCIVKGNGNNSIENGNISIENGNFRKLKDTKSGPTHIDEWIVEFAKVFKDHVGFESDVYLGLNELGIKVYSEAMEETVTSEEAQELFNTAARNFQEMAALALFNWGNVHMSRARKRVYLTEEASRESVLEQIKASYDWAMKEYTEAGQKYETALKIKPDFYEVILANGRQQFEQAKLIWYYTIGNNIDLEKWCFEEVMGLYNKAEENMERGMKMWEESEIELSKSKNRISSKPEAFEESKKMRSLIYLLWGTILYERSVMEFKLELPVWHETLEIAVEKFESAGASSTDITIMIKNQASNDTTMEGVGFKIDEIVQAWNDMYEAKTWDHEIPSFRLASLLRRQGSKLYDALELA